jgi:hypothetical protein
MGKVSQAEGSENEQSIFIAKNVAFERHRIGFVDRKLH